MVISRNKWLYSKYIFNVLLVYAAYWSSAFALNMPTKLNCSIATSRRLHGAILRYISPTVGAPPFAITGNVAIRQCGSKSQHGDISECQASGWISAVKNGCYPNFTPPGAKAATGGSPGGVSSKNGWGWGRIMRVKNTDNTVDLHISERPDADIDIEVATATNTTLHEHGAISTSVEAERDMAVSKASAEVRELGDAQGH